MVWSMKHEKSVSQSDHSNVNKPLHMFHFSHVFMLWTRFTDFSWGVIHSWSDQFAKKKKKKIAEKLKVTNDVAERGVKLMEEYSNKL